MTDTTPTAQYFVDVALEIAVDAIAGYTANKHVDEWAPDKLASFARSIAGVASVMQLAEHQQVVAAGEARQIEQLRYQRIAAGPLEAMVELVTELSKAADGQWDAAKVNRWARTAAELVASTP